MEQNENNWKAGEIVNFPWKENTFKKQGLVTYKHYYSSRFVCIRAAQDGQRGILLKVLGRLSARDITTVGGEPFCKDESDYSLTDKSYCSFRFPLLQDAKEALNVISENPSLMQALKEAEMHLDPKATFWVRETARSLFRRKLQFYDPKSGTVSPATDEEPHGRLSLLFFQDGNITL